MVSVFVTEVPSAPVNVAVSTTLTRALGLRSRKARTLRRSAALERMRIVPRVSAATSRLPFGNERRPSVRRPERTTPLPLTVHATPPQRTKSDTDRRLSSSWPPAVPRPTLSDNDGLNG